MFDIMIWMRNPVGIAWGLMPHFCPLHRSEAFILKYIDVRCQRFDSAVWCSALFFFFLFFFLEAGTSKWAEILLLYKRAALPESKDGTTQVVKAYIVWMALKRLCLWNCNISMQRTDITQSNMEVDRIALKQRRVYHNVNLGRSVFL